MIGWLLDKTWAVIVIVAKIIAWTIPILIMALGFALSIIAAATIALIGAVFGLAGILFAAMLWITPRTRAWFLKKVAWVKLQITYYRWGRERYWVENMEILK